MPEDSPVVEAASPNGDRVFTEDQRKQIADIFGIRLRDVAGLEEYARSRREGRASATERTILHNLDEAVAKYVHVFGGSAPDALVLMDNFIASIQGLGHSTPPADLWWYPADLLAGGLPDTRYVVEHVLPSNTYGAVGGAPKSMKSYIGQIALGLSIATGHPFLNQDEFVVNEPGKVVFFTGEGGKRSVALRLARVADCYGVEVPRSILCNELVAPLDSPQFLEQLKTAAADPDVRFISLDPTYAFWPGGTDGRQLMSTGPLLARATAVATTNGAVFFVNHHFNRDDKRTGLMRFTGAGMAEWVDSWFLLNHREPPDLNTGSFQLRMEVGSRQGGGGMDLDLDMKCEPAGTGMNAIEGVFDILTVIRASGADLPPASVDRKVREQQASLRAVLAYVKEFPNQITETMLREGKMKNGEPLPVSKSIPGGGIPTGRLAKASAVILQASGYIVTMTDRTLRLSPAAYSALDGAVPPGLDAFRLADDRVFIDVS